MQSSGINYIHSIVQPSPQSDLKVFITPKKMGICIFNSPAATEETYFENTGWSGLRLAEASLVGRTALFPKVPALFLCLFDILPLHLLPYRCCNSCEDVREAYRRRGWAFKNPDTIEQCRREGFSQKMQEQKNEGCQVYGFLEVNKVQEEPRQDRASWAVGWPHSTVNQGDKGKGGNGWRMRGHLPYRWRETSTLPPGRASSSPTCTVSDPTSAGSFSPWTPGEFECPFGCLLLYCLWPRADPETRTAVWQTVKSTG